MFAIKYEPIEGANAVLYLERIEETSSYLAL